MTCSCPCRLSLPSFPTRRSSDLRLAQPLVREVLGAHLLGLPFRLPFLAVVLEIPDQFLLLGIHRDHRLPALLRSEEHTSELQSLRHLVCRLLLEKKKQSTPPAHH